MAKAPVKKRLRHGIAADIPLWLKLALHEVGTKETPGRKNNPVVQNYYHDAVNAHNMADEVPWCAAFVGAMLKRAGFKPSGSLMARSYLNWGIPVEAKPGAIVVFARGRAPQGHVAIVVEEYSNKVRVVGGNQSDAVNITDYPKARVLGYRWPVLRQEGSVMPPTKSLRHGISDITAPIVAEVPVVDPNGTAANWVGLSAALSPILLWLAHYYGVPLTPEGAAAIFGGIAVLTGIFTFVKNRWYDASVTLSSAEHHGLKMIAKKS